MIIRPGSVPEEARPENALALKRILTADDTANLSITWVRLDGRHQRIVNAACDRAYYVIAGSARFQVGDGAPVEDVAAGDFVYIPHGTPYEFEGQMTYVVVNGPAFTLGSDRVLPSALT
jgi:mannose-6-phosphate isomerase-like protein (cupin superfamily)